MLCMTIPLPEDVFINAFTRSIRCDTWHSNSSRHCTEELISCMQKERYRQHLYKEGTHMQFLHFVAFSNSNECNQMTKVASINASRKPMKVSEAVQETLQQQPAENTQWSEMRICIFIANKAKKKKVKLKPLPNPPAVTRPQPCRWGSKEERAMTQSITFIQTWGSAVGHNLLAPVMWKLARKWWNTDEKIRHLYHVLGLLHINSEICLWECKFC